jgi:stress-induced morphogen
MLSAVLALSYGILAANFIDRAAASCRDGVVYAGRSRPMAMDANEIERLIKASIPDAKVTIRDLAGDGDHYAATVISASFKGKSRVQQHQIVYEALKAQMGGVLHALALQTATPDA